MSFSPGTKTPTLVARLMGLDLLPDNNNSSSSSSSSSLSTPIVNKKHGRDSNINNNNSEARHNPKARHHHHHIQITRHRHSTDSIGTIRRSLSETPRRSDVEHSRLSLQINKENIGVDDDDTYLETPGFSFSKRKFGENNNNSNSSSRSSPSQYAKQIVKQVKESVSRRVGMTDITNTIKNRDQESISPQIRFKKATKTSSNNESCSPGKQSPRLGRFVDTKHNNKKQPNSITKPSPSPSPLNSKDQKPLSTSPTTTTTPLPLAKIETQLSSKVDDLQSKKSSSVPKSKRSRTTTTTTEKLGSGVNRATPPQTSSIRKKQQESFIACALSPTRPTKTRNRSTHPLSSNLLNTAQNLLPFKTHSSPLPTKIIPQKQACDSQEQKLSTAQLSSCARQKYKKEAIQTPATATAATTTTGIDDEGPEFEYIKSILSRSGLGKATLPDMEYQWFSLSHPLDPSLFHYLENHCIFTQRDQLGPSCNRRLLFDLVDELLCEILARPKNERGLLVERVWRKVRRFPGAKCEFLEDIDGLIEMEEMERKVKEEREEGLVMEIGRSILETLVHETVTVFV
ncbi:hypothetical protein PIB30_102985 [Stylosanthes scabra]|uniref:DUF4378 domain-containing protein n=1 Tax=Stylosanthes scabra TaxID=79078 RepID=A0ABU6WWD3_9FABA|nr:hypothetical protein [Stylosanthes scabra]